MVVIILHRNQKNMFSQKFKKEHSFAAKFFEAAIKSEPVSKLGHAYILTGSDFMAQYYLAVQTAKILNCLNKSYLTDDFESCKCINCSWIAQNRHPAVITVSPVDFNHNAGKSESVIAVEQARNLKKTLSTSSQYHRVVIFTNAIEGKEYARQAELYWKDYQEILNPPPLEDKEERRIWIPSPLTYKVFRPDTANTLLKNIEEPASGITFFFLTRDKEDMISTIVSRCQTIPLFSGNNSLDFSVISGFLNNFPPKTIGEALFMAERLIEISKNESLKPEELLDLMQEYLRHLIKHNLENKPLVTNLTDFFGKIEKAKKELAAHMNSQPVYDTLFLSAIGLYK